jgi:hypothetical protein
MGDEKKGPKVSDAGQERPTPTQISLVAGVIEPADQEWFG